MRPKLHSTNCSLYSFTDTCFFYARHRFHLRLPLGPWTRSIFVSRSCPRHCIPLDQLESHWSLCYRRMVRSRGKLRRWILARQDYALRWRGRQRLCSQTQAGVGLAFASTPHRSGRSVSHSGLDCPSPLCLNSPSENATADGEVCVTSFQWRARRWRPGKESPLVVPLSYATYTTCKQSTRPK